MEPKDTLVQAVNQAVEQATEADTADSIVDKIMSEFPEVEDSRRADIRMGIAWKLKMRGNWPRVQIFTGEE